MISFNRGVLVIITMMLILPMIITHVIKFMERSVIIALARGGFTVNSPNSVLAELRKTSCNSWKFFMEF